MTQTQLAVFLREIEKQTTWGRNQLKDLILGILSGTIK